MFLFSTVEFLQRRLKNLKDGLKKCLSWRARVTKSGAGAQKLYKCQYFEQLMFLHEKTANKTTESNVTIITNENANQSNTAPTTQSQSAVSPDKPKPKVPETSLRSYGKRKLQNDVSH